MKEYVVLYSEIVEKVGLESAVVYGLLNNCYGGLSNAIVHEGYYYYQLPMSLITNVIPCMPEDHIMNSLLLLRLHGYIMVFKRDDKVFFSLLEEYREEKKPAKKKKKTKGFVYVLKCADKYKIGYSVNVEQRMSQLDTRPFPLELIYKIESDVAFDIEQRMHNAYTELGYRLDGEWYSSNLPINDVIRAIDYAVADNIGTDEAWREFEKKYEKQEN